jgi:hypothetical protein
LQVWSTDEMTLTRENQNTRRKPRPNATLSTTYLTQTVPGNSGSIP